MFLVLSWFERKPTYICWCQVIFTCCRSIHLYLFEFCIEAKCDAGCLCIVSNKNFLPPHNFSQWKQWNVKSASSRKSFFIFFDTYCFCCNAKTMNFARTQRVCITKWKKPWSFQHRITAVPRSLLSLHINKANEIFFFSECWFHFILLLISICIVLNLHNQRELFKRPRNKKNT